MFRRALDCREASAQSSGSIRTIPELIEFNARTNPNHVFCHQAQKVTTPGTSIDVPLHLQTITYLQLKQAILRCSEWFTNTFKGSIRPPYTNESGEVVKSRPVALLMASDVGLLFHLFSLMGLGVPVVLLSARLSATAIHSLLVENCVSNVVVSPSLHTTAQEALAMFVGSNEFTCSLQIHQPYGFFLDHQVAALSEGCVFHEKHYVCDDDRNVLILHSSGTTGLPKSIPNSHRYLLGYSTCHDFPIEQEALGLNTSTLPLYHGWGLVPICLSLSIGKSVCLPVPSTIPTAESILELLRASRSRSFMTVPSTLEEIFELPNKEGISVLRNLDFVACGGGPIKPFVAQALAADDVRIVNSFGVTEVGPLSILYVPRLGYHWQYFRLRKDMNIEIHPLPNTSTDSRSRCRLLVRPAGWQSKFQIGDEFVRNPHNPDHEFAPIGRTDDVIVLATGEKIFPGPIEAILSDLKDVRAAVAFGDGRLQLGVLIEPMGSLAVEMHDNFISALWPSIVEAGQKMDDHARISAKEVVLVLGPGVSFPRSDKGAVLRRDTYQIFEKIINNAYELLENPIAKELLDLSNQLNLENGLRRLVHSQLGWNIALNPDDDFFEHGMNSLQATNLRRLIQSGLPHPHERAEVFKDFVYKCPTISRMAKRLLKQDTLTMGREDSIQNLIEKYSFTPYDSMVLKQPPKTVVLVTGSTGSLGGHLVAHLAICKDVNRIICLNRFTDQDCNERQRIAMEAKGIYLSEESWAKIEICPIIIGAPFFGLPFPVYRQLCDRVTHIVHAAWPMNFKQDVSSFGVQFQHLNHLLKLAEDVHYSQPHVVPRFQFISSISVVGKYPEVVGKNNMIPETEMQDSRCTLTFGYAEAKLICEKIIQKASLSPHIKATIVRIGQISGAQKTGYWNPQEHFPALVKSSETIGCLPILNGTASWIPVDRAAIVLSDILFSPQPLTRLVYHLENPIRQPWHELINIIADQLSQEGVTRVSLKHWIEKVRAVPNNEDVNNPAKSLTDFFESDFESMDCGEVVMDTTATQSISPALMDTVPVSRDLIASYVRNWKVVSFLN